MFTKTDRDECVTILKAMKIVFKKQITPKAEFLRWSCGFLVELYSYPKTSIHQLLILVNNLLNSQRILESLLVLRALVHR